MRQPKYVEIAESFERRISRGDYAFSSLPGAQKLAGEMGVSYLTARQAVKYLIDRGAVERLSTGRLQVIGQVSKNDGPMVALITPFWNFSQWHSKIRSEVDAAQGKLRIVAYAHNDDPIITEALDGEFDIFFIMLPGEPGPMLIERLKKINGKVVVLFNDMTKHNLRSLLGAPISKLEEMLEGLINTGHQRIDCLNTQPNVQDIRDRVSLWEKTLKKHSIEGVLYNFPVQPFEVPGDPAYTHAKEILSREKIPDAIFCTTVEQAAGAYRACWELGLVVGEDISVCCFGEYEKARMMTPALCTVRSPDPGPMIGKIIKNLSTVKKYPDKMLYRPEGSEIFWGESIKNSSQ
jgi:LacI family transcriptional regulator, galactose operon repressor